MFIIKCKDGSTIEDSTLTWDDVSTPEGKYITALQLTLPFKAQRRDADGTFTPLPARTVTLTGYNRWYYYREATSTVLASPGALSQHGAPSDVAEVIGGIDDRNGLCFEIRVATDGNVNIKHFPIKQLAQAESSFRAGLPLKK